MEVYSKLKNNAGNPYPSNANAGTACKKREGLNHNMQMVRHIQEEENATKNNLIQIWVFKLISKNATKWLRIRQKTRVSKNAKATLKQIATQEFQIEKEKMQIWKQMIMQEVAQEL